MSESEIARLMESIETICASMNFVFRGYAQTAKHEIIHHKYEQLGEVQEQLSQYTGDVAAMQAVMEALDRTVKARGESQA